jgi:hypothetical protein
VTTIKPLPVESRSSLMPYNPALVAPMREEMVRLGAKELTTVSEVDAVLGDQ